MSIVFLNLAIKNCVCFAVCQHKASVNGGTVHVGISGAVIVSHGVANVAGPSTVPNTQTYEAPTQRAARLASLRRERFRKELVHADDSDGELVDEGDGKESISHLMFRYLADDDDHQIVIFSTGTMVNFCGMQDFQ